jgi:hypothetical protein
VNLDLSSNPSVTVTATAYDASGAVIPNALLRWSTSDPSVATVSPTSGTSGSATVSGVGPGGATLIVQSGNATDTAKIKVVK